ncbi:uncharacterized protein LOC135496532 [Lineus longissimus]|uniref:uncharacterized protein LOC135496532 n=1 Tax=Lineus longissimus TaxID=88925 RepID=UPI00315C50AD
MDEKQALKLRNKIMKEVKKEFEERFSNLEKKVDEEEGRGASTMVDIETLQQENDKFKVSTLEKLQALQTNMEKIERSSNRRYLSGMEEMERRLKDIRSLENKLEDKRKKLKKEHGEKKMISSREKNDGLIREVA